jgi:outer membrane receptor protein involved in Fe transport
MSTTNDLVDENLKGSLVTTYEAGVDLRLFKNRFGVNFVYYNEDNDLEPFICSGGSVSGFTNLVVNAVHVKREGIELQLNATIIKGKDLTWDATATFGYLIKNPIKNLYQDQQRVLLAGGAFGTRFARAFQELGFRLGSVNWRWYQAQS